MNSASESITYGNAGRILALFFGVRKGKYMKNGKKWKKSRVI
jgi:hypothetical protein